MSIVVVLLVVVFLPPFGAAVDRVLAMLVLWCCRCCGGVLGIFVCSWVFSNLPTAN